MSTDLLFRLQDVDLTYSLDGAQQICAVRGLSFEVGRGERIALIGPSGCGKTTTIDLLAGFIRPSRGVAFFKDAPVNGADGSRGVLFQSTTLFPWRSVAGNVAFGSKLQRLKRKEREEQVEELLETVGLRGLGDLYPFQLSGGMAQRVEVARVLANEPEALLLDEPFSRLDAQTRYRLQLWLMDLLDKLNMTLILVTHDIEEAILLADRVLVMSARPGRIETEVPISIADRKTLDVISSTEFGELKARLLDCLSAVGSVRTSNKDEGSLK